MRNLEYAAEWCALPLGQCPPLRGVRLVTGGGDPTLNGRGKMAREEIDMPRAAPHIGAGGDEQDAKGRGAHFPGANSGLRQKVSISVSIIGSRSHCRRRMRLRATPKKLR